MLCFYLRPVFSRWSFSIGAKSNSCECEWTQIWARSSAQLTRISHSIRTFKIEKQSISHMKKYNYPGRLNSTQTQVEPQFITTTCMQQGAQTNYGWRIDMIGRCVFVLAKRWRSGGGGVVNLLLIEWRRSVAAEHLAGTDERKMSNC